VRFVAEKLLVTLFQQHSAWISASFIRTAIELTSTLFSVILVHGKERSEAARDFEKNAASKHLVFKPQICDVMTALNSCAAAAKA
jgi:hypothetical protein